VLGVSQGERAMTTLRNLLALAGYRLEAKQNGRKGTASGFIEWWPNHSAGRGRHGSAGDGLARSVEPLRWGAAVILLSQNRPYRKGGWGSRHHH
jgi:hypothetical protein